MLTLAKNIFFVADDDNDLSTGNGERFIKDIVKVFSRIYDHSEFLFADLFSPQIRTSSHSGLAREFVNLFDSVIFTCFRSFHERLEQSGDNEPSATTALSSS